MTLPLAPAISSAPPWPANVRGDIANFSFDEGGFGQLVDSAVTPLPGITSWLLTSIGGGAAGTTACMTEHINAASSPQACFYQIKPTTAVLYSSFFWKVSNPFNSDGVKSFCDQVKVWRHLGAGFGTQMGSMFVGIGSASNGNVAFSWDQLTGAPGNRTANMNTPMPNLQTLMGQWMFFEMVTDLRVNNAVRFQLKMNGVQYFDYTDALSNIDPGTGLAGLYGTAQGRGTINQNVPSTSGSDEWLDEIRIDSFARGFLATPSY